jgi:hypothetical protein
MANSVSSELADFLMQMGQLLLACETQHGIPRGLPLRVVIDDQQRTVSIDVQRDGAWQHFLALDASPQSPTFGMAVAAGSKS